ncbi:MAG: hypothetical protein ACKVU4_13335 [Phycisphaerales bacterium]
MQSVIPVASWASVLLGVLLGLGGVAILVIGTLRRQAADEKPRPVFRPGITLLGGALVFIGVGGWGPGFLPQAAEFFKTIASLAQSSDESKVATDADALLADLSSGGLDPEYWSVAKAVLLYNPAPGLDARIDAAGAKAAARSDIQTYLAEIKSEYLALQASAVKRVEEAGAAGSPSEEALGKLDLSTLRYFQRAPPPIRGPVRVDPAKLKSVMDAKSRRIQPVR